MIQTTIFDAIYPQFKINKPIRLIELFSGYGSQALALKYLGVPFEHHKICEWAVKSIQAYKDIHFPKKYYWKDVETCTIPKEILVDTLFNVGISSNYNEPMSKKQIQRFSYESLVRIYENILITNNLVNIQGIKGEDLEIVETNKYCYIMTYSFPCQDLSLAGKRRGMNDTSTRSGMLWEVERILTECKELGTLPQVLLMENVPQVHGEGNTEDFNKWQLKLESLGYKNYWEDLIATDYGIPQTRNRCFMVSILGDYSYTFPPKQELKLKLKDMLEDNVDEKYYLSEKMLEYITSKDDKYKVNENKLVINRNIACSKTTREGNTRADTTDYICDELPDNFNIKNGCKQIYDLNYYNHEQSNRIYDTNHSSPTLRTKCDDAGTIKIEDIKTKDKLQKLSTTGIENNGVVLKNLRIRRLSPKECFRLMGVKDEDFEKCAKNQSNASLYHLAGDSIVVNVLMAIFKQILKERKKFKK